MSIQEHLNKIRNAIKGSEVRESIAKGIETAYDDASEKDNANMEVKIARGTHPNLRSRLEEVDNRQQQTTTQLAQKATASDVQAKLGGKRDKSVPIGLNDASSELLSAIQGGSETSFNLLSIPRAHSVTKDKTTFILSSTNLFDKDSIKEGFNLSPTGANDVANASYAVSGFIPVVHGFSYSFRNVARMSLYDESQVFISSASYPREVAHSLVMPANAQYIRVSIEISPTNNLNTAQLNEGDVLLPYEKYREPVFDGINIDGKNIENLSVEFNDLTFVEVTSNNLFNKGTVTPGESINPTTGEPVANELYSLSDFISFEPNAKITISHEFRIGYYDKDLKLISSAYHSRNDVPITLTTPSATRFVRVAFVTRELDMSQINKGGTLLPYDNFTFKLNGVDFSASSKNNNTPLNKYVVDGVVDGVYSGPILPANTDIDNMKSVDLFALYDALVDAYPNYIKRSVGTVTSEGKTIYRYDFKPTNVDKGELGNKLPKMILISGIHKELGNAYVLYQTMKQICEQWETSELLETLRWNVYFIVIPVVNIHAFDTWGRKNENEVDLARNFPTGWVHNPDPTSNTYGGEFPLSEIESQYVDGLMKNNSEDAIYFGSYHNFYSDVNENYIIWNAGASEAQVIRGKKLVSKMSRKWKKEYPWLPQDDVTYFGYSTTDAPPGSEGRHAESYGIPGSTFELCQQVMLDGEGYYSSNALTMGLEASVNWLLLNLKHNI